MFGARRPFAFSQLGGWITLGIHTLGNGYGIPASFQMVLYERRKARAGSDFTPAKHWWDDGVANGSYWITLLDAEMAIWEKVLLYFWYFVFGFGQLAAFTYLEMRGPVANWDPTLTAFRFRWVLLVG